MKGGFTYETINPFINTVKLVNDVSQSVIIYNNLTLRVMVTFICCLAVQEAIIRRHNFARIWLDLKR